MNFSQKIKIVFLKDFCITSYLNIDFSKFKRGSCKHLRGKKVWTLRREALRIFLLGWNMLKYASYFVMKRCITAKYLHTCQQYFSFQKIMKIVENLTKNIWKTNSIKDISMFNVIKDNTMAFLKASTKALYVNAKVL